MRLIVKQNDRVISEFQFEAGPVSIGRVAENQIVLSDKAVSKKHAVISCDQDGKWAIEDMDSANKTYLNDKAIHQSQIQTGDTIHISDFAIEIDLEEKADSPAQMEDTLQIEATLTTPKHETVVRKPDAAHAPAMRLAARRLTEFSQATEAISAATDLDELVITLLDVTLKQFDAFHVWCALRPQPGGPMTCHAGKKRNGQAIGLEEIKLAEKVTQAVEKGQSLVLPRVTAQLQAAEQIRSALIAAILLSDGCYGVLYIDNAMIQNHYSLSDLDYLMFIAIHTAATIKNL
ncbi:FHA domain-containing protein [Planctomycetota bacterium]